MNSFTYYTKGRKAGTLRSRLNSAEVRRKLISQGQDPLTLVWESRKHAAAVHAEAKADLFRD